MSTRQGRLDPNVHVPTIEEVAAEHTKFIRAVLLRLHVEHSDVDDVAQLVLLATSGSLATFDPILSTDPSRAILGLLVRICARYAADYRLNLAKRRRLLAEPIDPEQAAEMESPAPSPEAQMIVKEREKLLGELLEEIPADRRAVISAHDLEGTVMTEISSAAGIPANTCWTRRHLGLEDLRAAWRRRGGKLR